MIKGVLTINWEIVLHNPDLKLSYYRATYHNYKPVPARLRWYTI
jgi:hypothetical protein